MRDEQAAVCSFKIALADYERQKGTILQSRQIMIADGPLPRCVQPHASSQIRDWFSAKSAYTGELSPSLTVLPALATPIDPPLTGHLDPPVSDYRIRNATEQRRICDRGE